MALLHSRYHKWSTASSFARDSLKKNPAKFITLMNACCNLSNTNIAIEKPNGF